MTQPREIRTAPYGQPPIGTHGPENEVLNPGRFQYGPTSSTGYEKNLVIGTFDPWTFIWLDDLLRTVDDEDDGGDDIPEAPEYDLEAPTPTAQVLSWYINGNNEWQSGPPANRAAQDNALPKAGYWTNKNGPNKNKDSDKDAGYQMLTSKDRPIMLYNMGHENIFSEGGAADTNVIGWDGYISFDKRDMGVPHAYAMYTLNMTPNMLIDLIKEIISWLTASKNGTEFVPSNNPDVSHVGPILEAGVYHQTRGSIFIVVRKLVKALIKIANQLFADGVPGGVLVNWDYIAELVNPTQANVYQRPPDQTVLFPTSKEMDLYKFSGSGPHGPYRFSATIEKEARLLLAITKMRANGVLWHLSSPKDSVIHTRIMRVTNFAHIHALSPFIDIDDARNSKYRQVLHYWDKKNDPDPFKDKSIRIDTRG